jgi:F420-non-reducing hydrogenase large subunit
MRKISIDPVTRLEGHGKISIFLNDEGDVENCYFQVPELRGFEQFCVGRPVEEMPRITTRICGVCPEAHHMASAKACDAVYQAEPPPAARKLRELLYSCFFVGDHTLHFYALGGPDFVVGPDAPAADRNILGVINRVGLDAGKKVIELRRRAQHAISLIGGKAIHPVTCLPGGIAKPLTAEERGQIVEHTGYFLDFAKFTLKLIDTVVLKTSAYLDMIFSDTYSERVYSMGMVDANKKVTAALDPAMVREVLDVIRGLRDQGLTMLIVTHEMAFAEKVADRIIFMESGKILEENTPGKFFAAPDTQEAKRFLNLSNDF